MTATAEQRATAPEPSTPSTLDRAEGVELLGDVHGSGYKEGAALARRQDGQMVQLGPLMYTLLDCVDGRRTTGELATCMSEKLGRRFDEQHVVRLAQKLAAQGLLAGTEHQAPPRRNPLLALRWKVLVTNPRTTKWLTAPFTFLFLPFVMWPLLACFVGVFWFVLIHKGVASATAEAFHSPALLLLVFVLAVASAGFHELGHASACRYGGATPGGMGMGLYLVWPAFYTDVTDSYRLPRAARLRVDLGGLYFNAVVSVLTMGVWLAWRIDALLLLVALQILQMVKQLSPVIRADGYHILSDATGVPDLYSHMLPTLRRLLPWHRREPSALTGRARLIVTLWVLIFVPVLLSLMLGAVLLLPRLATSAWDSGRAIASAMPHQAEHDQIIDLLASVVRLIALFLPVLGSALVTQKIVRTMVGKARGWSGGRPVRQLALIVVAAALLCGAAWAWWPSGQYQPVRADEHGTLVSYRTLVSSPQRVARPNAFPARVQLAPGKHLAIAMIPVGGATKQHPALFVIPGKDGDPPAAIVSDSAPDPTQSTTAASGTGTGTAPTTTTSTAGAPQASDSVPVAATAFPFKLPSAPRPGDSQALAVGTQDGGVKYDIAYSLVTVSNGAPVTNTNSAFAFANCKSCTTVAVSFQIVLIVGESKLIAPINAAGALNVNCPACMTTAIADQIVVTLKKQPSQELVDKLTAALKQLNGLSALGANGTPAAVASQVATVQQQIESALNASGDLAQPITTTPTSTTATSTTPASSPSTSSSSADAKTSTDSTSTTAASSSTTPTSTTPASTTPTKTSTTQNTSTTPTQTSTTSTSTTSTDTTSTTSTTDTTTTSTTETTTTTP